MMLGLALGDAVGRPLELLSREEIESLPRATFPADSNDPLETTDDTAMSVAVAEALASAGGDGPDALMAAVVERFLHWRRTVTERQRPGNTCLEATYRLEAGVPWNESGVSWSKGSGAVKRAAPVGFFFARYTVLLREVSRMIAAVTHGHPSAAAGAVVVSVATREALAGTDPAFWIDRAVTTLSGTACGEMVEALRDVPDAVRLKSDAEAMESLGEGWVSEEAVAMAIAAVLRHPDDFAGAVRCAVRHRGDSDTVGCIAGALSGARLGQASLPKNWLARLEGADEIRNLSDRLAAARENLR